MTHSHTRRMYIRKKPPEPGCGVINLHRIQFVGVVPSALNALHGPMTALAQALFPRN